MRHDTDTLDLMPEAAPAAKPKTPLPTLKVPAGAEKKLCPCGATIYSVEQPSGRFAPIHCDVDGGRAPTDDADGIGINHFIDCPRRDEFRRRRR